MKYLRCSLTLVFTLLLAAAAQAQQASARVIVHQDGLDIRLNDQARWNAATSWPGALRVAQDVINELERSCRGCYQIDRGKLAFQIAYHAAASYIPNEGVQLHANPVNVTWPELYNPPDLNRTLMGAPRIREYQDRERAARANAQEALDRMREQTRAGQEAILSGRSPGNSFREANRAVTDYTRSVIEAGRARREASEAGRAAREVREATQPRDNDSLDDWRDRVRERNDRRPD